jgi:hypothetical protein
MDAWAKSQRRPLPGSSAITTNNNSPSSNNSNNEKNIIDINDNLHHQKQLQLHPQQQLTSTQRLNQQQLPLGAAAQRAHRIHTSLVKMYKATGDPHLAPSTISYNAAINAWSKSYHPSAGEMAELLLGEMMREWRFGNDELGGEKDGEYEYNDDDYDYDETERPTGKLHRGNERVKPDVVTFTAV